MKLDQQDIAHRMRATAMLQAKETRPSDVRWFIGAIVASVGLIVALVVFVI